ncbi:C40 family peptidase [Pseudofulvibacter geojedonensis]|uniref:NlpC/P60 family protein n=1 Tax=Pseudofulvibacter geojedonensis TaxID=1123758 RepID=A0ABW3I3I0_9FLAO
MRKHYILIFVLTVLLISCKSKSRVVTSKSPSSKPKTYTTKKPINSSIPKSNTEKPNSNSTNSVSTSKKADKIVSKALSFKGTRYKYGGTSKSGMDCSGLMFTSFKSVNIHLPRTSIAQSNFGKNIKTKNIQKGDLLFFKTGRKNQINHVGLVISVKGRDVKFIHSSSSRGVMISSLKEGYWSNAYTKAKRVLTDFKETVNTKPTVIANSNGLKHKVQKGDTLYSIARKHNTSVNAIMKRNNLSSTNLKLGTVLIIPNK